MLNASTLPRSSAALKCPVRSSRATGPQLCRLPPFHSVLRVGAGDPALIRRMGRHGDSIAAALAAPERSEYVRLDRLGHGGTSISDC